MHKQSDLQHSLTTYEDTQLKKEGNVFQIFFFWWFLKCQIYKSHFRTKAQSKHKAGELGSDQLRGRKVPDILQLSGWVKHEQKSLFSGKRERREDRLMKWT